MPLLPPTHTKRLSPDSPLLVLDDDDAIFSSASRALHALEPSVLLEVCVGIRGKDRFTRLRTPRIHA